MFKECAGVIQDRRVNFRGLYLKYYCYFYPSDRVPSEMNQINGLPLILQQCLDNLFCTKSLKSWTIHEGKQSVVTLRFLQCDPDNADPSADQSRENETKTYRHVSRNNNQKIRDRQRAANHRNPYATRNNNSIEQPRSNAFDNLFSAYSPVYTSYLSPEAPAFEPNRDSPLLSTGSPPVHGDIDVTTAPCRDEKPTPEENVPHIVESLCTDPVSVDEPRPPTEPTEDIFPDSHSITSQPPEISLVQEDSKSSDMASADPPASGGHDSDEDGGKTEPGASPFDGADLQCHLCKYKAADDIYWETKGKCAVCYGICVDCKNFCESLSNAAEDENTPQSQCNGQDSTPKKKPRKKKK